MIFYVEFVAGSCKQFWWALINYVTNEKILKKEEFVRNWAQRKLEICWPEHWLSRKCSSRNSELLNCFKNLIKFTPKNISSQNFTSLPQRLIISNLLNNKLLRIHAQLDRWSFLEKSFSTVNFIFAHFFRELQINLRCSTYAWEFLSFRKQREKEKLLVSSFTMSFKANSFLIGNLASWMWQ